MLDHPIPLKLPSVEEERCRLCSKCVARKACRTRALTTIDPGESPFVNSSLCYGCLACIPACPFDAIVA